LRGCNFSIVSGRAGFVKLCAVVPKPNRARREGAMRFQWKPG
jgi:hypothetical protein